jgi:hypothetical protein
VNKNVYLKGRLGGDGVALMAAFKSWFQPSVAVAAAVERSFITGKVRTGLTIQVSYSISLLFQIFSLLSAVLSHNQQTAKLQQNAWLQQFPQTSFFFECLYMLCAMKLSSLDTTGKFFLACYVMSVAGRPLLTAAS